MIITDLRRILGKIKRRLLTLISKSGTLTAFYYLINSKGFRHEQKAVLSGIMENLNSDNNLANFRRDIHRIEKGLITEPSKPIFAENYILKSVLTYKKLINSNCEKPTLYWAEGIFNQYFETVQKSVAILAAYEEFKNIKIIHNDILPRTYQACERDKTKISIEDFYGLNKQRRSIRYYQNKKVPREFLEKAIRIALQSPSACNRQPFSFRIVDDPILVKIASQLPMGSATFSDNIPVMIFVIGDLSSYFDERDKHIIYIDGALAAMNLILGLEIQSLSSCIINWSDIPSKNTKLRELLNLQEWEQCVMSISVGFALSDCGVPSSIKKDIKTVVKYN